MKTAQRLAYAVMSMSEEEARQFAEAIISAKTDVGYCKICQNLTEFDVCPICSDTNRDDSVVCVVETPKDVTAFERTNEYGGTYHVLHGLLSPINGIGPDNIKIKELLDRVGSLKALYDRSEGLFRRQIILTTRPKAASRTDDPFIAEKMCAEAEGIFLWCLEGLRRLIANGYSFTLSERARGNMAEAVSDGNNVVDFMRSEGYIRFRADSEASSRDLYAVYRLWCEDNALNPSRRGALACTSARTSSSTASSRATTSTCPAAAACAVRGRGAAAARGVSLRRRATAYMRTLVHEELN